MSSFLIFFSLSFVLVDICEHLLLRDFASLIDLFFFFEKVFVHCVDLKVCFLDRLKHFCLCSFVSEVSS